MERFSLTYDSDNVIARVVSNIANELGLECSWKPQSGLVFHSKVKASEILRLESRLIEYGLIIINRSEHDLIDQIKAILTASVYSEKFRSLKISVVLSSALGYSYTYLSHIFSQATYTTIENFLILAKIERVKDLLLQTDKNLTEIAHQMDYSSVSHLSSQFKKTTGLTVTQFIKLKSLKNNKHS